MPYASIEDLRKNINDFTNAEAVKLQAWLDALRVRGGTVTVAVIDSILQPTITNLNNLGSSTVNPIPVTTAQIPPVK